MCVCVCEKARDRERSLGSEANANFCEKLISDVSRKLSTKRITRVGKLKMSQKNLPTLFLQISCKKARPSYTSVIIIFI